MAAAPGKEQGHGRVVGSRYTMGDEIGRGASGVVHKALGVDTAADGREGLIGRLDKLDTQIEQALESASGAVSS